MKIMDVEIVVRIAQKRALCISYVSYLRVCTNIIVAGVAR